MYPVFAVNPATVGSAIARTQADRMHDRAGETSTLAQAMGLCAPSRPGSRPFSAILWLCPPS